MTDSTEVRRYCELDVNRCSLTYGNAPCAASVGVTGDFKCYNSPRTCQDPANYDGSETKTIRWVMPTGGDGSPEDAIPSITNISRRPQRIMPGESLGVRESVTVSFGNHRHNDVGFDDYLADRTGNPYDKGTFWGKFFARYGSLEGNAFRTIDRNITSQSDDSVTRHYIVDAYNGADSAGRVSIVAKDVIKFFDNKKAQAPLPSQGTLLNNITDAANSLVLTPAGIGDLEYPASGTASIGDERMTFTRVGDNVTLFNRGSSGTTAEAHDAGETFQLALVYDADDIATIINDLITNYTETPADYINLTEWQEEVANYLPRLYSAEIMRPTSIKTLLDELISEVGLVFYTDLENKKLVLKAFRSLVPTTTINDTIATAGSIKNKKLSDRRVDRIWIWYGKFNPLQEQSQTKNYRSVYVESSGDPVVALEANPPAIRDIFSRWILVGATSTVEDLASNMLTRYQTAPREFSFSVRNTTPVKLGEAVSIQSRVFENPEGDIEDPFTGQIVSIENRNGYISAVAEELPPGIETDPLRLIQIDADMFNINLRSLHDSLYSTPQSGDTVRLLINSDVIIGSTVTTIPALDIGSWPAGVTVEVGGLGRIQGRGGNGGSTDGFDGGDALKTTYAINIIDDLEIWSGGGGGAGVQTAGMPTEYAAGGGGAGTNIGFTGAEGNNSFSRTIANDEFGGSVVGSNTSQGGGAGNDGSSIGGVGLGTPGVAGNAIDGVSNVTIGGGVTPDIRGYQIG